MHAAFWNSDYRHTGNGVNSSDRLVLCENCKNITGFFYVSEMWILPLYIMLEQTTVAHSKEKIRHSRNISTLVKAICHLHQQPNLWVGMWHDYVHGQKIVLDRYYNICRVLCRDLSMEEAQSEEASRGITNGSAHITVAVHGVRFVSPSVTPYTSLFSLSTRVCLHLLFINTCLFTAFTCLCTVSFNTFHISHYYVFTFSTC